MGNNSSTPCTDDVNQVSTNPMNGLTTDQLIILAGVGNPIMYLRDPKRTHQTIMENLEMYQSLNKTTSLFFQVGAYKFRNLGIAPEQRLMQWLDTKIHQLMHNTNLSPGDLDELWALYYVSGDRKFADRIKHIATDDAPHIAVVRAAAEWSYNSHVDQGLITSTGDAPEINTPF